jgi:hypothetical protein
MIARIGKMDIISDTTVADTVEALPSDQRRSMLYLKNEGSSVLYFAFGNYDETVSDYAVDGSDMMELEAGKDIFLSDGAVPTGQIFLLSVGGTLNFKWGSA